MSIKSGLVFVLCVFAFASGGLSAQDIDAKPLPTEATPKPATEIITTIEPDCPLGYRYDASNNKCIQNKDPVCPPGKVWQNGTCVEERYTNVQCPEGYYMTHFKCVKVADPICPPGTEYRNGYCVEEISTPTECPIGYRKEGNTCVLIAEPVCPVGTVWKNNVCVRLEVVCPEGFVSENSICVQRACPETHYWSDGVCKIKIEQVVTCPEGQKLTNGKCEPEEAPMPAPESSTRCPDGMEFFAGRCRVFYCPAGYILQNNRCIQIACPDNTVWTGTSCELPPEIKSVFEITHEIFNHFNYSTPNVTLTNVNEVNILNNGTILPSCCAQAGNCSTSTTEAPARLTATTTTTTQSPTSVSEDTCCTLVTPRVCKKFDERWICVNRRHNRCGSFCTSPVIYLKPPTVVYRPPVMVLPPNPPMQVCSDEDNCSGESIDCSGCPENKPETCSAYCYEYHCPKNDCTFLDQESFCKRYPKSEGCTESDGCLSEWCTDNTAWNPNQDVAKPCP